MAEEFYESEVLFSDKFDDAAADDVPSPAEDKELLETQKLLEKVKFDHDDDQTEKKKKKKKKEKISTPPMNIPVHQLGLGFLDEDEEEEMVPPHLIISRRLAGKMTFSMCTGNGRTLKGRDLSTVRNSILRMTGFIEV